MADKKCQICAFNDRGVGPCIYCKDKSEWHPKGKIKFIQYKDTKHWWMCPEGSNNIYNIWGGRHPVNKSSEEFIGATVVEAEDWADLCRQTNYDPWKTETPTSEMWISPVGAMYDCGEVYSHGTTAYCILRYIYRDPNSSKFYDCGNRLIQLGWTKVSTNDSLCDYYRESGIYDNCTPEQWKVLAEWRDKFI